MVAAKNIFDQLEEEDLNVFDSVETEDNAIDNLKTQLNVVLNQIDDKARKKDRESLKAEFEKTLKEEIAKIKPIQQVIEKTVQTKVIEPRYYEPKVVEAPPAPPQIIREVRVEVEKKDPRKYVEEFKFTDLLMKISKLETQLKETRRMAESPIVIQPGGSGVIGIPPPEPNPENYVLTVVNGKAKWAASSGGSDSSDTKYFGDSTTDGSWRITHSGTDLLVQRLESGVWVEKGAYMP